jgi:putative tricarboxylic transport membrane protein
MDRIYGFVTFFLGAGILWQGRHLGIGSLREPGPGFFPNLVAILMMILSLFLIIPKRKGGEEGKSFSAQFTIRVVIVLVALLAYSFALEYLGFVVVSFLLMAYLFRAFGGSRRWYGAVLWALASVGMTYLLFEVLLEGNLPKGVFGV